MRKLLTKVKPKYIFHLAGCNQSNSKNLDVLIKKNVLPTISLLNTILTQIKNFSPRIILIGSAAEYGKIKPKDLPVTEKYSPKPTTDYGKTKFLQTNIALLYYKLGLDIVIARVFNVIGPNMPENLAIGSFIKQINDIKKQRLKSQIYVGNIKTKRDFIDVRDVVEALLYLAKKGTAGEIYNVCSGKSVSIASILKKMCSLNKLNIKFVYDKTRMRKNDLKNIYGSYKKIFLHTGWKPKIPLAQTIKEISSI